MESFEPLENGTSGNRISWSKGENGTVRQEWEVSPDQGKTWQLIYPIETIGFFDFLVKDGVIYGGTRVWDEYRGRN